MFLRRGGDAREAGTSERAKDVPEVVGVEDFVTASRHGMRDSSEDYGQPVRGDVGYSPQPVLPHSSQVTVHKMKDEASYNCDSCGEEIVIPIDVSAGSSQAYVEDCPVCCHPNVIHVEFEANGEVRVWAHAE